MSTRLTWLFAIACLLIAVARPTPASAHPLGNFTINHLVKADIRHGKLELRYVLDMAEIPTFQVMRERSATAAMDAAQLRAWASDEIGSIESEINVSADGERLALAPAVSSVRTRPGAGGLPTLYWVEVFRASIPAGARRITIDDNTFPGRIGWKDVVVSPATEPTDELQRYPSTLIASPRDTTSVAFDIRSTGAVDKRSTKVDRSSQTSQARANTLSDMLARGTGDPWIVVLTLLAAIGLGALHAAEPGHGKTLLAVSLVGARATPKQALLLAVGLTAAHTAGVLLLGGVLLVAARWIVPETIYPWVTLLSGVAVACLGANALARFVRERRGLTHAIDQGRPHHHEHHRTVTGDGPLSFRGVMLVAMSGNIAPCPAALVVLLAALALHEVGYGIAVVVAFSVGLAAVLTGLGIALVRGAGWLAKQQKFDTLTAYAPLASACVISVIGAVMLGQGASSGAFDAPPVVVIALTLAAVAAYAFSPGHAHAHRWPHAHEHGAAS